MQVEVRKPSIGKLRKQRVCAYARVSTDSLEQEDSLENQTTYFRDYIQHNPAWEFAGIYSDQGISGFKENRPGFKRMIDDARAGKINLIVVKSVSRFARNTETVLKFSRELKSIGVGIFFQLQNINTLTAEGELMLTIIAAFAQAESEGASDNAKLTYRRKFQAGKPVRGLEVTYGYTLDEAGEVIICEEQAEVVRLIYDMAEKGVWPSKIKKYLNKHGIARPSGSGEWDDTAVHRILHNISYKGDLILQKTYLDARRIRHKNGGQVDQWYVAEDHPPIVSDEQWERVQEVLQHRSEHLAERKGPKPAPRSSFSTYPLSGKLFCPLCGAKLIHKWCNKGHDEYWACRTNLKVGAAACKGVWLPGRIAATWGDITEPTTVIAYEDEYGMKQYTGFPKDEYELSEDCPYFIGKD